jgi:hypothetical protein
MERRSSRDRDDDRGRDRDRSSSRDRDDDRGSRSRSREDERGGSRGASRGGFSYQRRSAEQVNKRASMGGKDFDVLFRDDIPSFKPNDGPNTVRILPPTWPNPDHYGLDLWVHYGIGPDNQAYLCLHKMKGEACPICEEHERARRAGEDEDYVKSLEPTRRVLMYLVDRDHEKDGVQAWAAPWTIDRDITKISVDRRTQDVLPIDDPDDGYDVEFERTGKGMTTKYVGVAIARRESPLGKAAWLDFAVENPLPDMLVYMDYDHIAKVLGGGGGHRTRAEKDGDARDRRDDRDSRSRDRDDDRRGSRDRDRDEDRSSRSSSSRREEPKLTWDDVHAMEGKELDALVEEEKLDLNPDKFDSDSELADAICKELGIEKPEREHRRRDETHKEDDAPGARLRRMRESRGD